MVFTVYCWAVNGRLLGLSHTHKVITDDSVDSVTDFFTPMSRTHFNLPWTLTKQKALF
jgi:hypothetical protein